MIVNTTNMVINLASFIGIRTSREQHWLPVIATVSSKCVREAH